MRIDPSRLSQLLLALGQKTEATRTGAAARTEAGTARATGRGPGRDLKVLRKDIGHRLQTLDPDAEGYDRAAATITLQEILAWEFGADILDHQEFPRVCTSIVDTLLADARMAASLRKLAHDLSRS